MHSLLTLRWVPGTLDRVTVRTPLGDGEVAVALVSRVLGREALEGLYLSGCFVLDACEHEAWEIAGRLLPGAVFAATAAD